MFTHNITKQLLPSTQNDCPTSRIFWFQNDCHVSLADYKFEAQSQIFLCQTFYVKKSFDTATSRDTSQ